MEFYMIYDDNRKRAEIFDKILKDLKWNRTIQSITIKEVLDRVGEGDQPLYRMEYIDELADKEYIYKSGTGEIRILPKGTAFLSEGGYTAQLNRKEEKLKQEELINKVSESTLESNKYNRKVSKWNLIIAVANTIFFLINIYLSFVKK